MRTLKSLLSKAPYLIVVLLLAYAAVSLVPLSVWNENRLTVALMLGIILIALILYFKWLRNSLSFLNTWPTPAVNSWVRRYLLLRDYTPRTARTRKQVIVSLLIPCLVILLLVTATSATSLFLPVSDRFRDAVYGSSLPFLLGCVFLNPMIYGLVFRLRLRYNLANALLSVVMYLPMFVFAITSLVHMASFLLDGQTPFLSVTWFEIFLGGYFGSIVCILVVATHRVGIDPEPAPAITAYRFYQPTEKAVSVGSLIGVAAVALLASTRSL